MTAPQKSGPLSRQISLTSNDRANAAVTLQGEAKVLSAVQVEPGTVNFAQVKRDAPEQKQTVVIKRGDGGPVKPTVANVGGSQIKADLREIEAGEKYELDVTISPPWPNGMLRGSVVLATGIEQAPAETIQVFANVTPRLSAVPGQFMINAAPQKELDLSVRLNWDGDPAKIIEATSSDPETSVKVDEESDRQIVMLHVPAGYNPENKMGNSVTVRTDDPVVSVLQIPIRVIANQPTRTGAGQVVAPAGRVVPMRSTAQPTAATRPAAGVPAQSSDPPK